MKKVFILLIILLALTGCVQKKELNDNDIDSIFNNLLNIDTSLVNNNSKGYKYYLPNGVTMIYSNNYNETFYCNYNYYYMYIDVVSYYYKVNTDYTINSSIYYSKKLNYNNKEGYIEIDKVDDVYNIKMYYNYAKIETKVSENNIKQTLINISYILNSLQFNDKVIGYKIDSDDDTLKEETFDFYTPRSEGNFIDYISQYDDYKEETKEDNNLGKEE